MIELLAVVGLIFVLFSLPALIVWARSGAEAARREFARGFSSLWLIVGIIVCVYAVGRVVAYVTGVRLP